MQRYIDAKELDDRIKIKEPPFDMNAKAKEGFKTALLSVRSMIHSANAAYVQEVKRGKWILKHIGAGHYWECSICNGTLLGITEGMNYCPYCGAKMEDNKDEEQCS